MSTLSQRCERRGAGLRRFDRLRRRAPSLTFMTEDAPQRNHALRPPCPPPFPPLRGAGGGRLHRPRFGRLSASHGSALGMMPNAPPPWYTVYQQTQRRLKAGVVATLVHDLRAPPLPPGRRGKGGAQRAPAMTGINVPPCPPPHAGGKGGAARSTWLKRFITFMLEST